MDIVEFLQLSSGKWFSQRTSHHIAVQQSESGKSDLQIAWLDKTDPAVVQLCKQCDIDPDLALGGAQVIWDGAMDWDKKKRAGSTLLVPIADANQPNAGKLLRDNHAAQKLPVIGHYVMGNDDALTLMTEYDQVRSQERFWFVSPNLRLRTTILTQPDGSSQASFCSEIRMGVTKPPAA